MIPFGETNNQVTTLTAVHTQDRDRRYKM